MPSSKLWQRIRAGLVSLSLMTLLASCATAPQTRIALPNEALYKSDVDVPTLKENATNGDLAQFVLDLKTALGIANADRASLRVWANKVKETSNGNRKP